ncbi:MAG: Hsp20/alpha crystallin family protein [Dehalococcoidia bacterium]
MMGDRGPLEPTLAAGERILFRSQGGYKDHPRSGWKLGRLYLTNRRLLFLSQTSVIFETLLSEIQDLKVEKQRYVAGRIKEVIALRYRPVTRLSTGRAFVITGDLEALRNALYEMVLPELDGGAVEVVAEELDGESRAILTHLWDQGHATTGELAELIEASSPVDVLFSIRGCINPTAERLLGCPLVVFDRESANNGTNRKGSLNWRLITRKGRWEQEPPVPFLDILDEGRHLNVLMELVGVREDEILLGVGRDRVIVSVEGGDRACREEIPLPCRVSTERLTRTYNNNILAISLQKLDDGERGGHPRLNDD